MVLSTLMRRPWLFLRKETIESAFPTSAAVDVLSLFLLFRRLKYVSLRVMNATPHGKRNEQNRTVFGHLLLNHSAHIRTRFWRRKIPTSCVKMLVNPTPICDDKPKSTVNRTFQACSDMCVMVNIKNARACFSSSGGLLICFRNCYIGNI